MKTCHPLLLLFTALLTMNLHCEKDDPQVDFTNSQNQLPPITTTGANTFGCTVNGKNWVAYTDYSFPKLMVSNVKEFQSFQIVANINKKNRTDDETMELFFYKVEASGEYILGHQLDSSKYGHVLFSPPYAFGYTFVTDSIHTGTLEILKIDTVNRIVSGKFMADLIYYDSSVSDSIIQIRNGRFDVKY